MFYCAVTLCPAITVASASADKGTQALRMGKCCASRSRMTKLVMDQGGLVNYNRKVEIVREQLEGNA